MYRRKATSPAFTIVELLIVIVVIAILATVVTVAYNGVQDRARASAAQTAVQQALTKIQTYAVDNSENYPATLAAVGISDSSSTTYQYTVDNTASPRAYCITATVSGVNYYVSQTVSTPTVGTCTPVVATSSVFGSTYPYPATYYSDGGGSLKVATVFYSYSAPFTLKGGRVYLPSVPSGVSLTVFYVVGWYQSGVFQMPTWSQVPSGIPNQYVTIPNSSLVAGWNEVTFPTPATLSPYGPGVTGTPVWVGYYFSDGNGYVYTNSPQATAIQSVNNPNLWLAETSFQGQDRSANSVTGGKWTTALYGIDVLTTGP